LGILLEPPADPGGVSGGWGPRTAPEGLGLQEIAPH